jgi:hypothetical protein
MNLRFYYESKESRFKANDINPIMKIKVFGDSQEALEMTTTHISYH